MQVIYISRKQIKLMIILLAIALCSILLFTIIPKHTLSNKVIKIGVIDSLIPETYSLKYDVVKNYKIVQDIKLSNHGETILSIIKKDSNAKIYYVSTLDSSLKASIDDVIKAINICIANHVDIINMSFATTEDNPRLKKAIQNALQNNIIIVASCINNYNGYSYPANYAGVISVSDGKSGKDNIVTVNKQEFSIELLDGDVVNISGTSYATAYVTNVIDKELTGRSRSYITKQIK